MSNSCIFCKIINKEVPAKVIAENDTILVIQDIAPKAPTHFLIIPKKHIKDVTQLELADATLMGDLMLMAKQLSTDLPEPKAFGLIMNNGAAAGQSVFHLHCHFVSGKRMTQL